MTAAITFEQLGDYVADAGSAQDTATFEEALFDAVLEDDGAPELQRFDAFFVRLRELHARGTFEAVVSPAQARQTAARSPLRVGLYRYPARVDLDAFIRDADIVFLELPVELRDVERVDVELGLAGGPTLKVLPDVEFTPEAGAIVLCCEQELAARELSAEVEATVIGHVRGERRVLGTFRGKDVHTPGGRQR